VASCALWGAAAIPHAGEFERSVRVLPTTKTNIHRTMSFLYDNCASTKFLLLSKEKVADGGISTIKFVHIFRRRMTDKVSCLCDKIFIRNYILNHLIRLLMALNVLDLKDLSAIKIHLLLKEEKEFSNFQSAYALWRAHTMTSIYSKSISCYFLGDVSADTIELLR